MNSNELMPAAVKDFYKEEVPITFEMKCPLVLVLDKSSSMAGAPIDELNRGLKIFQTQIQNDDVASARLETAIVTFGSDVEVIRDFSLFDGTGIETIEAEGITQMVEGIREAMNRIESRKAWYKEQGLQYYRPYIVLMTDGYPTSSKESISKLIRDLQAAVKAKKFNFWAFGVEGANMEFLKKIAPAGFPPQKLKGHNFVDFFSWLSASFGIITGSKPDETIDISPKPDQNPFQITV